MVDKKLVILSGPSCVGKGPLRQALARFHPEIRYAETVICNSRNPRLKKSGSYEVHGKDYYFLPRGIFYQLDPDRFIIGNVRSDIQAIDMDEVRDLLKMNDLVLIEAYHTLGQAVMEWAERQTDLDFSVISVMLVPLSEKEIKAESCRKGIDFRGVIYETMKDKLTRRGEDSPAKIEERALSAYDELLAAEKYTDCIVNRAGEDARDEWFGDTLGKEALRVLEEFVSILMGTQKIKRGGI